MGTVPGTLLAEGLGEGLGECSRNCWFSWVSCRMRCCAVSSRRNREASDARWETGTGEVGER
jgi:hypothetical protein